MEFSTLQSSTSIDTTSFDVVDPSDQGEMDRWLDGHAINKDDLDEFTADDGTGYRFYG